MRTLTALALATALLATMGTAQATTSTTHKKKHHSSSSSHKKSEKPKADTAKGDKAPK